VTRLSVTRSPVRQTMVVLAGALLIVVALDVMVIHNVQFGQCEPEPTALCIRDLAGPPETDEDTGALTVRGRSQRRTDYFWGIPMLLVGGALAAVGAGGLLRRRPVVEIDDNAISVRISGPLQPATVIPWSNVSWVHSGADGYDEAVPPRTLLVHVADRDDFPPAPWGASWDGNTLMIDADSWRIAPEDVVFHARVALEEHRRVASGAGDEGEDVV
jgi:hypothetical protein